MYVFILNPTGQYCNSVLCAIGAGLSHLFLGATLIVILFYSLVKHFSDVHVILCSFGFHFFSAQAILGLSYANGWSMPMHLRHRRFAHVTLQVCGVSCALTGTVAVILEKGVSLKLHGLTGLIAAVLAGISVVSGLFTFLGKESGLGTCHMTFGMSTFLLSSISLCSGLFYKTFKDWAGDTVVYILLAFIIFYTTFIVISSFMKCMARV